MNCDRPGAESTEAMTSVFEASTGVVASVMFGTKWHSHINASMYRVETAQTETSFQTGTCILIEVLVEYQ
jgi:hypothetical protein